MGCEMCEMGRARKGTAAVSRSGSSALPVSPLSCRSVPSLCVFPVLFLSSCSSSSPARWPCVSRGAVCASRGGGNDGGGWETEKQTKQKKKKWPGQRGMADRRRRRGEKDKTCSDERAFGTASLHSQANTARTAGGLRSALTHRHLCVGCIRRQIATASTICSAQLLHQPAQPFTPRTDECASGCRCSRQQRRERALPRRGARLRDGRHATGQGRRGEQQRQR